MVVKHSSPRNCFRHRGATSSGAGSPKPEGEGVVADGEASTPGKESGRGFCEIQWPWWRGSTDSASKSSKSKVNLISLLIYLKSLLISLPITTSINVQCVYYYKYFFFIDRNHLRNPNRNSFWTTLEKLSNVLVSWFGLLVSTRLFILSPTTSRITYTIYVYTYKFQIMYIPTYI